MEKNTIDILWVLLSAVLVFIMQGGFLCLESGLTRAKNSINVAIKNLTDLGISGMLFWMFGFAFMFGESHLGLFGTTDFFVSFDVGESWRMAFFFFQMMFCSTATTIVAGAVAERMTFTAYIITSLIVSGLIYPVFGHWAWAAANGGQLGWLQACGFVDFAGATVVHSVGGWVALAAILVIGPRVGRFDEKGNPQQILGSNLPLAMLGVILLFLGWFGFNGGSLLSMNNQVAGVIVNTMMGGVAGLVVTLIVGWAVHQLPEATLPMNGTLAGLVAVTASTRMIDTTSAVIIGAVGGLVMLVTQYLLERWRIDDAVGAIPVHLGAGIWGTLAVPLFGKPYLIGTGLAPWQQLQVQIFGILICCLFSFGSAYVILSFINLFFPFRVTPEGEQVGLNVSEHRAKTEWVDLLGGMEYQVISGDLSYRVPEEPFTEVGQIARQYNRVMESLQKLTSRINAIVNNISEGVVTFTGDGMLTSLNPAAERIFNVSSGEIKGQSIEKILFVPNDRGEKGVATLVEVLSKNDRARGMDLEGIKKDGSRFNVEVTIGKGKVDHDDFYTGIIRDISERKRVEEVLRVNEERNRSVIETANDAFISINAGGRIIQWNHKAEVIFGWLTEETLGKRLDELIIPPRYREAHHKGLQRFFETGEGSVLWETVQLTALRRNGEEFPVEITIWPLRIKGTFQFNAFLRDITETLRIQNELKRTNQELAQSEKEARTALKELEKANLDLKQAQMKLLQSEKLASIGQLAAGIAHEINNPIGFIKSNLQTLEQYMGAYTQVFGGMERLKESVLLGDMEKANATVEEIKKIQEETNLEFIRNDLGDLIRESQAGTERIRKIILDLRTFARKGGDNMELTRIEEVIDNIINITHNELKYKAELKRDYGNVPPVLCNPQRMGQVFINLLVNAVQAIEEKGTIEIRTYQQGEFVCIDVSDTGCGIEEANIIKIFDAFFTTKPVGKGTGLGLSVSYDIVKSHGGEIKVRSQEGNGSTFTVFLPVKGLSQ